MLIIEVGYRSIAINIESHQIYKVQFIENTRLKAYMVRQHVK